MRLVWVLVIMVFTGTSGLFAWWDSPAGGFAGQIYEIPLDARSASLGYSGYAESRRINPSFWSSPTSSAFGSYQSLNFTWGQLFGLTQILGLDYFHPLSERFSYAIGLLNLGPGTIEETSTFGEIGGEISSNNFLFGVSLTDHLRDDLWTAGRLKFVRQNLGPENSGGFGLDGSLHYRLTPTINLAFGIENILAPRAGEDEFARIIKIGRSQRFNRKWLLNTDISLAIVGNFEFLTGFFAGLEREVSDNFSLRLGINNQQVAFGFGLDTERLSFSYCFLIHPLDFGHLLSLNLRYGFLPEKMAEEVKEKISDLSERQREFQEHVRKTKEELLREREKLANESLATAMFYRAERIFKEGNILESKKILLDLLKKYPDYEPAKVLLTEINIRLDIKSIERFFAEAEKAYRERSYGRVLELTEKVLSLDRNHQKAKFLHFMAQGQLFLKDKKYLQAKGEFLEALKIFPDNDEVNELLKRVQTVIDIEQLEK